MGSSKQDFACTSISMAVVHTDTSTGYV